MKMFTTDEEAVSPVIGVILMVAIVVILAAVIAAFVFGMAGGTGTAKNIGMTVTVNDTAAILTLQGGADLPQLTGMQWSIGNGSFYNIQDSLGQTGVLVNYTVGNILYAHNDFRGERLLVRGNFTDGSQQVIFDRRY